MFKKVSYFTVFLAFVISFGHSLCVSHANAQESFIVEYGGNTQDSALNEPTNSTDSSIVAPTRQISSAEQNQRASQSSIQARPDLLAPKKTIKVGLLLPLSGGAAHIGQSLLNAAQQALFEIAPNYIELVIEDTKGTAEGADTAARKIADQGVQIILGPFFSHSVKAVAPIARSRNLNVISFSTDWTAAGRNVYVMGFVPFDQVQRVVSYTSMQGVDFFAGLVPETSYGQAVLETFEKTLYALGKPPMKVAALSVNNSNPTKLIRDFSEYDERRNTAIQMLPPEERTSFSSRSDPIKKDTNADSNTGQNAQARLRLPKTSYDALLLPLASNTLPSITSLLTHYDVDLNSIKLLGTGIWDDSALFSEPALEKAWYAAPDPRTRQSFTQSYKDTFGHTPHRLATLGYDAVALASVLAYRGIKQGGRPAYNHQSITTPVGFSGLDGIFRFQQSGIVERGLAVLEIRNGTPIIIDPAPKRFN